MASGADISSIGDALIRLYNRKNTRQNKDFEAGAFSDYTLSGTFEVINKNLRSFPYSLTYSGSNISTIVYDLGGGLSVTKTYSYSGSKLTSVVLSGDLPVELEFLTKTLSYTGSKVTSVTYS